MNRDDGPRKASLHVVTDESADFWLETHYGFIRDSGHFLVFPTGEAFTAELRVQGDFQALYDQAGIMVRVDAQHWVKAGIEFTEGRAMLASVLTHGQWATAPYEHDAGDFRVCASVANGVLRLQASADGKLWPLKRLAPFAKAKSQGSTISAEEAASGETYLLEYSCGPSAIGHPVLPCALAVGGSWNHAGAETGSSPEPAGKRFHFLDGLGNPDQTSDVEIPNRGV